MNTADICLIKQIAQSRKMFFERCIDMILTYFSELMLGIKFLSNMTTFQNLTGSEKIFKRGLLIKNDFNVDS